MLSSSLYKALWRPLRYWIYLCCLFFVISAGLHFYKKAVIFSELKQLEEEKASLEKKQRVQETRLRVAGVTLPTIKQMEKDLHQFLAMIPARKDFSGFVGELFELSQQAELNIDQINYQPRVDSENGYLFYTVNFSVEGNYEQLKKFIYLLENSPRILIVEHIALNEKKSHKAKIVSLRITLTTLFQGGD
nr:type 4a pilus biogenesis protein PilO [uncultured Desulfuromonas sp.]